jgi:hypothetical protein
MYRLSAYVLAADPTWLEHSVGAYYPFVDKIIVSYDRSGRGWTGAPIPVDECIARLKAIDGDRKMRFVGGCFSGPVWDPMENDTLQRNTALAIANEGADWVLQIDTDEWLPSFEVLNKAILRADEIGVPAVEWPMRVLYRALSDGNFLEVCGTDKLDQFEFIAPIAVRAGTPLAHSRRTNSSFLRAVVRGDTRSTQLLRPLGPGEFREELLEPMQAIVHNSWARSPRELRRKLRSWSHSGAKAWMYYAARWLPAVWFWPWMRNLHPFFGEVWPSLRIYPHGLPNNGAKCCMASKDANSSESPASI